MKNTKDDIICGKIDSTEMTIMPDDVINGCLAAIGAYINRIPEKNQIEIQNYIFDTINKMRENYMDNMIV